MPQSNPLLQLLTARSIRAATTATFTASTPAQAHLRWKTFVNGNQEFTFGNLVLKSSPAVVDGTVYIGSLDGYLYALDC